MPKAYVIIVAGGSGSGKTLLSHRLQSHAGANQALVVSLDRYYRDNSHLNLAERSKLDFDCWEVLDGDRLVNDVAALKDRQRPVKLPSYDFSTHCRLAAEDTTLPAPIVIVEGILALYDPRLRSLADDSIFLDVNQETCFLRRLNRDTTERGRSPGSVRAQWTATVAPNYERLVLPTRQYAKRVMTEQTDEAYRAVIEDILRAKSAQQS